MASANSISAQANGTHVQALNGDGTEDQPQSKSHAQPDPSKSKSQNPNPTSSASQPSPQKSSQESALSHLQSYCSAQQIYVSPSIAAQTYSGRGLGVYTLRPIRKGEKLIHVPTKALLTTRSIPESFLAKNVRGKMSVHCALAAFLAFGLSDDTDGVKDGKGKEGEKRRSYGDWIGTWPGWEDFLVGLPVFWGEDLRVLKKKHRDETGEYGVFGGGQLDEKAEGKRAKKRRKTITEEENVNGTKDVLPDSAGVEPLFSRSPDIDDCWLTLPSSSASSAPTDTSKTKYSSGSHLTKQADKMRACIASIDRHLPHLNIRSPASHDKYLKFLYMWSCVNTRCFYYLRPGQIPPEDSNEAMALCPFQDLFNHSDAKGCGGEFDKRGFFVRADKDYRIGEELFLKYGKHTNDMLWMEYGFLMDENQDDELQIDRVVLNGLTGKDRSALKEVGYLGEYVLKADGVCYRTVVASYLGVLERDQWKRLVSGGFDPEAGTTFAAWRLKAKRNIVNWIVMVRKEAEENLRVLLRLDQEADLLAAFIEGAGEANLTNEQRSSTDRKLEIAMRRKEMCVRRWKQIFDMCMSAVREVERDCPGAFVIEDKEDRTSARLEEMSAQFIEKLREGSKG